MIAIVPSVEYNNGTPHSHILLVITSAPLPMTVIKATYDLTTHIPIQSELNSSLRLTCVAPHCCV